MLSIPLLSPIEISQVLYNNQVRKARTKKKNELISLQKKLKTCKLRIIGLESRYKELFHRITITQEHIEESRSILIKWHEWNAKALNLKIELDIRTQLTLKTLS